MQQEISSFTQFPGILNLHGQSDKMAVRTRQRTDNLHGGCDYLERL